LTRDDALVEFVGDQVMVAAARRLIVELRDPKHEIAFPIGVGLHMGVASVGNVGKGEVKDFTAVGDVVNTTARLQSCAKAGQIVLSKGKSEPLEAYVIHEPSNGPNLAV
jgi:adenylate cyclase